MTSVQILLMILAVAAGTMLTRFLPFLVFPQNRQAPAYVAFLGRVLPPAMMGLLVVFCFKNVSFTASPFGAPEAIATLAIAALHRWKNNVLLSIGLGTAVYMALVQLVF